MTSRTGPEEKPHADSGRGDAAPILRRGMLGEISRFTIHPAPPAISPSITELVTARAPGRANRLTMALRAAYP